ncbi:MAG: tetratricopeptide repeat protein [Spirochaetia bacterium]|jgi:Flp pilus assembly protein TadD
MRQRSIIAIAAGFLGLCALGAAFFIFLLPLIFPPPDITPKLAVIDEAIAGGYLSTARAELLAIRPAQRRESDALRLLKRAFILSRETGDFNLLAAVGNRAMSANGGSGGVRLVAAYASLRAGRLSDAESLAARGLRGGTADLLRGEIILRGGGTWPGSDSLTRELVKLDGSAKASDFTAAARQVDDKRLGLDAALLSLESGDLAGARAIASSQLQEQRFDEPASLIAYDSGDFETAITRLSRLQGVRGPRADIALLLADCYHDLGRSGDFEAALRDSIALDPRISWTPYANLGLLAEKRGDIPQARQALGRGRALFSGSRELVLATARLEADQGSTDTAISLLDGLVAERPDDSMAALLRLQLKAPGMTPQAYRAELWKLFDRLPSDRAVFMTLASALVASHDWEGAALELHQHAEAGGPEDADTLSLRGLVEAMRGRNDLAQDSLRQAAALKEDGRYRYDLAVVLLHQGKPQEALLQLQQARREAGGGSPNADDLPARIETLSGRCMLAAGDVVGARNAFLRARVLDPHLLRPALELRKLEAGGVQ